MCNCKRDAGEDVEYNLSISLKYRHMLRHGRMNGSLEVSSTPFCFLIKIH